MAKADFNPATDGNKRVFLAGLFGFCAGIALIVGANILQAQADSDFPKYLFLFGLILIVGSAVFLWIVVLKARDRRRATEQDHFLTSLTREAAARGLPQRSASGSAGSLQANAMKASVVPKPAIGLSRVAAPSHLAMKGRVSGLAQALFLVGFPLLAAGVATLLDRLMGLEGNFVFGGIAAILGAATTVYAAIRIRQSRYHCPGCDSLDCTLSSSPLRDKGLFGSRSKNRLLTCRSCGTICQVPPSLIRPIFYTLFASCLVFVVVGFAGDPRERGDDRASKFFVFFGLWFIGMFALAVGSMYRNCRPPEILAGATGMNTQAENGAPSVLRND